MGSAGHFNTSSTAKDITASTKIRKVGPKASKSFILICFSICGYRWEILEWILQSENRSKICYQKVRLRVVDLEDQKVRLRAVWMGRKIESFRSSNLGSILELKFRVEKLAVLEAQKAP